MSWDQQFDDPIVLPGRKPLVTLRDAALYITKLPKAEHDADEWRAAMEGSYFATINIVRATVPQMVEQAVHVWDVFHWIFGGPPVRAHGHDLVDAHPPLDPAIHGDILVQRKVLPGLIP